MEVGVHDVGDGRVLRRLPDTYAVTGELAVDAVDGAFNRENHRIDGGFIHVANIGIMVSRSDQQVAVVVIAQIQKGDGVRILGDDSRAGFAGRDGTKDTGYVHGYTFL